MSDPLALLREYVTANQAVTRDGDDIVIGCVSSHFSFCYFIYLESFSIFFLLLFFLSFLCFFLRFTFTMCLTLSFFFPSPFSVSLVFPVTRKPPLNPERESSTTLTLYVSFCISSCLFSLFSLCHSDALLPLPRSSFHLYPLPPLLHSFGST